MEDGSIAPRTAGCLEQKLLFGFGNQVLIPSLPTAKDSDERVRLATQLGELSIIIIDPT